jgi:hypothetical protein
MLKACDLLISASILNAAPMGGGPVGGGHTPGVHRLLMFFIPGDQVRGE